MLLYSIYFNSHAHVERDTRLITLSQTAINFNSHAHVERDLLPEGDYDFTVAISTHTLTWSVTLHIFPYTSPISNFNSHAHVERDYANR